MNYSDKMGERIALCEKVEKERERDMKCYIGLVNESARGKERDSFWLRGMQGVCFFLYIYI